MGVEDVHRIFHGHGKDAGSLRSLGLRQTGYTLPLSVSIAAYRLDLLRSVLEEDVDCAALRGGRSKV